MCLKDSIRLCRDRVADTWLKIVLIRIWPTESKWKKVHFRVFFPLKLRVRVQIDLIHTCWESFWSDQKKNWFQHFLVPPKCAPTHKNWFQHFFGSKFFWVQYFFVSTFFGSTCLEVKNFTFKVEPTFFGPTCFEVKNFRFKVDLLSLNYICCFWKVWRFSF